MPSQKVLLSALPRAELQAAVGRLDIPVKDRRRIDDLVAALVSAKSVDLAAILATVSVAGLKNLVADFELTPSGRAKPALNEALVAAAPQRRAAKPAKAAVTSAKPAKAAKASVPPAKTAKPVKDVKAAAPAKKASAKAAAAPAPVAEAPAATDTPGVILKAKRGRPKKTAVAPPAELEPVISESAPVPAEPVAAAAPESEAAPVKKPVRRGPLSWSEAAQMAEDRGQSAATMLQPTMPQTQGERSHTCIKCHGVVALQACQVQACNNLYVASPGRKICSECMFERNTISMDDFNVRLHEERQCSHCQMPMTHLSAPGNS